MFLLKYFFSLPPQDISRLGFVENDPKAVDSCIYRD